MSYNPYLKRLLGEVRAAVDTNTATPAESPAAPKASTAFDTDAAPKVQELVQLWNQGEHMAVAARLMFTPANYVDFVDLVFTLGREPARELGTLLDELSDTEGMKPPQTPPQYQELLKTVAKADTADRLV